MIQQCTEQTSGFSWRLLLISHSSTCFALWNQYEDEYSNYKITKCKILSVNTESSPCSFLRLHPDLVLPVSSLIHCSRPRLGFPAPTSISHSFPTFSQGDLGQITSLLCSEPSISLDKSQSSHPKAPYNLPVNLPALISSHSPLLTLHETHSSVFLQLSLPFLPQGLCTCNPTCLELSSPRQEHASLTSFSFLLKSRWMHSLPPCKKFHLSSQHQSPKHLFSKALWPSTMQHVFTNLFGVCSPHRKVSSRIHMSCSLLCSCA